MVKFVSNQQILLDETPINCERFLRHEGLKLFHLCYAQFPNETELVRNMMGLIGNIAEVELLRGQLMQDEYINIFSYVAIGPGLNSVVFQIPIEKYK